MLLLGSASAMWAPIGDDELLARAGLIVVGEWRGAASADGMSKSGSAGRIAVSEVLKGKRTLTTIRVESAASSSAYSSTDLVFRNGDRGLWLLRRAPGQADVYLIDHPQRFIPIPGGEKRIQTLRRLLED